jgi:Spy/CpxP family protein refolding chaperone
MQHKKLKMKFKKALTVAAAGVLLAGSALAQQYNMGHDMMGGHGSGYGSGYGMGPGMMGGMGVGTGGMRGNADGAMASLKPSAEQRKKIADIRATSSKAMWQLMGTMHEQDDHMQGMYGLGAVDEAAARKSFQTMTESRQAMFDLQLDTRKKIVGVLTKEQREQLAQ